MVGNLDEVLLRLEGDDSACGMRGSIRGFAPENIKSNLGKRSRGQTRKMKRHSDKKNRRSKRRHSDKKNRRSKRRRSRIQKAMP